jgi:quinol-cytochrome oxidoreductase complex cytochrome b subunit
MTALLPTSWRPDPRRLLPEDARDYRGPRIATWIIGAFLVLITVRSLIHLFSPDGGAESIATIDTSVEGGANIIAIFGQWGAIQLLLAALLWVLLLRYRGLLPLIALVLLVEPLLRELSGRLKPVETMGPAPGAALNSAAIVVMALLLYLTLCPADGARREP